MGLSSENDPLDSLIPQMERLEALTTVPSIMYHSKHDYYSMHARTEYDDAAKALSAYLQRRGFRKWQSECIDILAVKGLGNEWDSDTEEDDSDEETVWA